MRLLDQVIGQLGGQEPLKRLALEQANIDDPQPMTPQEVTNLAAYLWQHHPEAFGRAAQLGREEPGLRRSQCGWPYEGRNSGRHHGPASAPPAGGNR